QRRNFSTAPSPASYARPPDETAPPTFSEPHPQSPQSHSTSAPSPEIPAPAPPHDLHATSTPTSLPAAPQTAAFHPPRLPRHAHTHEHRPAPPGHLGDAS